MAVKRFSGHQQGSGTVQLTGLTVNTTYQITDLIVAADESPENVGFQVSLSDDVNGGFFETIVEPGNKLQLTDLINGPIGSTGTNGRIQLVISNPTNISYSTDIPEIHYYIAGTNP